MRNVTVDPHFEQYCIGKGFILRLSDFQNGGYRTAQGIANQDAIGVY
jgi:hypothetical protein